MKIDILSLFPTMFDGFLTESIIGKAIKNNHVEINIINFRDYSLDKHKKVDDYPFGGGSGMVLTPQPIFDCIDAIKTSDSKVILMTPQGIKHSQSEAIKMTKFKHIIIICGHYEGFDERIRTLADIELSIGDYVLTGGELASMVVVDSVVRLLNGVIKEDSHIEDSFTNNLLDYPTYTRPANFRGMEVPEILLSGHHANIEKYRMDEKIKRTKQRRPDLLD